MFELFFETTSKNLLSGYIPESLGLLVFGFGLLIFAVILRRIFKQKETVKGEKFAGKRPRYS